MESLGEPSEIIVLREADLDRPDKEEDEEPQDLKKSSDADGHPSVSMEEILESIKDGKTAPSQDVVNNDLEALRSQTSWGEAGSPTKLPFQEYIKLRQKVFDSYSTKQLWGYLLHLENNAKGRSTSRSATARREKSGITRSQWVPAYSPRQTRLPSEDTFKAKRELLSKKVKLVDKILRSHWKAETEGEQGQLELTLRRWQLELLSAGGMSGASTFRLSLRSEQKLLRFSIK